MIDTVVLLIPKKMVQFADSWDLYSKTSSYEKYVRNASSQEKANGDYFPRLSGYKRKGFYIEDTIRIEFSVPKILYKNNLKELQENDFESVINTLKDRLDTMGAIIDTDTLGRASVSTVHFAKNIPLSSGYSSRMLIGEMQKVNTSKQLDVSRAKYTNYGETFYIHASSYEFVIYDKIADIQKSQKRSVDTDQTAYQMNMLDGSDPRGPHSEVIRFEVRLNKKTKLNKILEKL